MTKLIVGVTGKIGTGKSTTCKAIKKLFERYELTVDIMDCDSLFKSRVMGDKLYNDSLNRLLGVTDSMSLTTTEKAKIIKRMTKTKYKQFIHDINFHMYPVFVDFANRISSDVILIESAFLLDTPLCLQCDSILELSVNRGLREQRVLIRDQDLRSKEDTISIFNVQEKFLTSTYRGSLGKVVRKYRLVSDEILQYVAFNNFLVEYVKTLKEKNLENLNV
jgi:dephospho-CoA kinase